jgi:hypothetical protein
VNECAEEGGSVLALAVLRGCYDDDDDDNDDDDFVSFRVIECAEEGGSVLALAVHEGVLYSTASDNKIRLYDLTTGNDDLSR